VSNSKPHIRAQTLEELKKQFADWDYPVFRVAQLLHWLYAQRVSDWSEMRNLPKTLRDQLAATFAIDRMSVVRTQGARDTTRKFLWKLSDGAMVESVLIPANPALYGDSSDRHTLCVSTQVGCAYGCKFCASGLDGWKRNLGAQEIVDQVLAVEEIGAEERVSAPDPAAVEVSKEPSRAVRMVNNLVIMGMGEPLANYDNLLRALGILNASWGGGIGARKITVSTSGLAPQIRKLAAEPYQFQLAISLHGATDLVRNRIMPINHKYPIQELTNACCDYVKAKGRMITIEYILIAGVNDGLDQVKPLSELARRLHAKVNLIPYNSVDGLTWRRPEDHHQTAFAAALSRQNVPTTLRREKGHDIDAACGQLRLRTEREVASEVASEAAS
jgi:23S rRNA (adenine2503-C2)-methyltransferase